MTDRALRPLFPKGFRNDVQIIITVLSADMENDPDVLATIGASAALSYLRHPFRRPGFGRCASATSTANTSSTPPTAQLKESDLDLVVSSTREKVIMVEAGANSVSEDIFLEAVKLATRPTRS